MDRGHVRDDRFPEWRQRLQNGRTARIGSYEKRKTESAFGFQTASLNKGRRAWFRGAIVWLCD